jgi:hypothetical protein
MEKISWTDHVRNEEVLLRDSEQRNILHEIRKRKANWIGHIATKCGLQIFHINVSTLEVKDESIYASHPLKCPCGMDREMSPVHASSQSPSFTLNTKQ